MNFASAATAGYRYGAPTWAAPAGVVRLDGSTMGTGWTLKLPAASGVPLGRVRAAVESALDAVVREMSHWTPDSDLGRYNRSPAGSWHTLPAAFAEVLGEALDLASDTDGAYDPTIGPLVAAWGFGPDADPSGRVAPEAVAAARARTGWRGLEYDRAGRRLLQPGGAALDLSSIAKGHAVDAVVTAVAALGLTDLLVEVGGELRALGRRPDGDVWRVRVKLPDRDADAPGPVITLRDAAVATSGDDYQRRRDRDGRRHSHTLDPRSGRPVEHDLASVTVVHPRCRRADALATAYAVLGPTDGYAAAVREGVAALFVRRTDDGGHAVRMTPSFEVLLR